MKRNTRRIASAFIALSMLGSLSACGGNPSPENQPAAGGGEQDKSTIVFACRAEPPTLDTMNQNYMMTCVSTLLTHNCLVRVSDDLTPEPDLAKSWETVSDTEWIFHLNEGVKFHDGSDMTADDVVATLQLAATVPQAQQYVEKITNVEAVDDYTVKITTDGPCSSLLMDLTNQQVAILSKDDIDAGVDFNTHINGTGPYEFVEYVSGDKLEYKANENYFNAEEKATIEHMVWRFIPEGSARTIAFEAGEVDYLYDLDTVDVEKLKANPNVSVLEQDSVALKYLLLNNEKEPFNNELFRKAISAAIDRESIIQVTMNGFAKSVISCAPQGYQSSTDENAVGYDLEKAKQYLEESGVDPSTVEMPLVCASDEDLRTGAIIQANLAELGINVELVSMDGATWISSYNSGDYTAGLTQLAQRTMQQWLTTIYHSKFINATNGARVNDPKVDEYLDLAAITLDEEENNEILRECVAHLNDLCPVVPLFAQTYVKAYDSGLEGANCNATGAAYYHLLSWK